MKTVWQVYTYDVWGNRRDGYDVNDVYRQGTVEINLRPNRHNTGTPHEFVSYSPTDRQLFRALGLQGLRGGIDTDGDDVNIYVNRSRDGYPLAELRCISHESLSPARKAKRDV